MNASELKRETEVGEGVDGEDSILRYFESFLVCVDNFEGEVVVSEHVEGEGQMLGDGAGWFDIVIILADVFQVESDGGGCFVLIDDPVFRGGKCREYESQEDHHQDQSTIHLLINDRFLIKIRNIFEII